MSAFSAPGKVVLLGDYAVLEGSRALVAAIDRRATVRAEDGGLDSPVVAAVRALLAERGLGEGATKAISIDTAAFADASGRKLGVGSSAAAGVLATAALLDRDDEGVLELAVEAHRRATGGGSGVDLAASFWGGVLATPRQPAPVSPLPSRVPGLSLRVLAAPESASTSEMVARARQAPRWKTWAAVLGEAAEAGIVAWSHGQASAVLAAVARAGRALQGLGAEAGSPIVTPAMEAAMVLAGRRGGALKPSGAGGGDVVVLFAPDAEIGALTAEIGAATGLADLGLAIDPRGLARAQSR